MLSKVIDASMPSEGRLKGEAPKYRFLPPDQEEGTMGGWRSVRSAEGMRNG